MTRLLIALLLLAALLPSMGQEAAPAPPTPKVVVIPIEGEMSKATTYIVRRGVKEALEQKASALILSMDTPGGEGQATLEMMDIVAKFEPQDRTYTLVTKEAYSAGAFLAASTRHIYMQPGTVIGAATPVVMGQGGPVELPPKFVSAFSAKLRVAAERNGHDTEVFDAMVNKQRGLVKDGKEIVGKGDILTLTDQEAAAAYGKPPRPLLSAGTVESIETLVGKIAPGATIIRIEPTGMERLAAFIVMLSPLLIGGAMLCGYIEFKTPGFGVFGILAVLLALVFFFGHYVAGLSGYEFVLLFLLGVVLIAVELFIFPGLILPGLIGACLVLISLLKAMVDRYPTDPVIPTLPMIQLPLTNLLIGMGASVIGMALVARYLPHSPLARVLVLDSTNPAPLPVAQTAPSLGTVGRTLSYLRPVGTADFGGAPVEVCTEGEFIPAGTEVRVLRVEGNRIVVEAVS